uniref:Nuclear receptor domain-containing protein n=1 Tax=Ditylenchus dipsaci TaxID=166011 RepID=A0A915E8G2_9BILA
MHNLNSFKNVEEKPKYCLVCLQPTHCMHYNIPSCYGCKSSFRRIILSGRRFTCYSENLASFKHVLRCRACRFDRSILMGMNPLFLKLPEGTDIDAICAEIANRRHYLSKKYKDAKQIWMQVMGAETSAASS